MQPSKPCPFCDPAQAYRYIVEGNNFRVMYPKNPEGAYHVLITPKQHIATIDDIPSGYFEELGQTIKLLSKTAKQHLGEKYAGFNILSNNGGPLVNQQVMHCHVHVFLRTSDDKPLRLSDHHQPIHDFTPTELEHLAELQSWFTPVN
jgi:diadenosine tetraphosphate (Ap4A) HIT family hydrolase